MNRKLKAKLLRALRSGAYEQGDSYLVNHEGTKFCCLGVLADIQGCVWEESKYDNGLHPIMPRGRETFGVGGDGESKQSCYLKPAKAGGLSISEQRHLATMNDSGKSFSEIADYIEANL